MGRKTSRKIFWFKLLGDPVHGPGIHRTSRPKVPLFQSWAWEPIGQRGAIKVLVIVLLVFGRSRKNILGLGPTRGGKPHQKKKVKISGWSNLTIGGETLICFLFLPRSLGEKDSQFDLHIFFQMGGNKKSSN